MVKRLLASADVDWLYLRPLYERHCTSLVEVKELWTFEELMEYHRGLGAIGEIKEHFIDKIKRKIK